MKTFRIFIVFTAVLCVLSSALQLRGEDFGPITVQPLPLIGNYSEYTEHGYEEIHYRITNKDTKTHRVELRQSSSGNVYSEYYLQEIKNTADMPAGTSAVIHLLHPPIEFQRNAEIFISVDGVRQKDPLPLSFASNHGMLSSYKSQANLLVSQGVPADTRDLIRTEYKPEEKKDKDTEKKAAVTPPYNSNTNTLVPMLSSVPVSEWSESFLFYTRFDCVMLTVKEYGELETDKPAVLAAIRKYTELGGLLCIVVDNEKKHNWKPPKEWSAKELTANPSGVQTFRALLGDVYILGTLKGNEDRINPFRGKVLNQKTILVYRLTGLKTLNDTLPVITHYGIPVKMIIVLIFLFAVIIGPVNIFVLHYIKRRIWLLWTVPLLSFFACIIVLTASLVQEGFLYQSSSVSFTILDQRREEALTTGYAGFYSTFSPSGLTFSPDTEVTFCYKNGYSSTRNPLYYELQGGNQLLTSGWIQARIPAYFVLRKAQSQRKERIIFDFKKEESTAVNGFGTDILRLAVRSPEGQLYEAENIRAGEKVVLRKSDTPPENPDFYNSLGKEQEFSRDLLRTGSFTRYNKYNLPSGSYYAETETWNPFLETGLEKLKPFKNKTLIRGLF